MSSIAAALQSSDPFSDFEASRWTLMAAAPLLALAAGVVLLLLSDVFSFSRAVRNAVFAAAILTAATVELLTLRMAGFQHGLHLAGSLEVSPATCLFGLVFLAGTLLAWLYSRGYYGAGDRPFEPEHDALMLAVPAGMMLMVGANDLLVFFVGLELLSIPLYVLAGFQRTRSRSVEAGVKYFLLGSFAAAFFLYGAALVYSATGHIRLPELHDAVAELSASGGARGLLVTGGALLAASLFFKVAVFPMHLWAPDVYQGAPTPSAALMATGAKAAAFGFLVKATFLLPVEAWGTIAAISIITLAAGNLGALAQSDVKRMLAWSGVAHAGTVLLVVAASLHAATLDPAPRIDAEGAALFYLAAYVVTATGAFGVLSLLEGDGEHFTRLENLRGLARSRPGVAAAMTLFLLSLGGIPATGGFLGKWFVFAALVRADLVGLAVAGVLLSVVALGYYLRVIVAMYMEPAPEQLAAPATRRLPATAATAACAAGVLALGLWPRFLLDQLG